MKVEINCAIVTILENLSLAFHYLLEHRKNAFFLAPELYLFHVDVCVESKFIYELPKEFVANSCPLVENSLQKEDIYPAGSSSYHI